MRYRQKNPHPKKSGENVFQLIDKCNFVYKLSINVMVNLSIRISSIALNASTIATYILHKQVIHSPRIKIPLL